MSDQGSCNYWRTFVLWTALAIYLVGGFLTNAYCQIHRWNNWQESSSSIDENEKLIGATIMWPVYWAARASIALVEQPGQESRSGARLLER